MTVWQSLGAFILICLVFLARSAWKQGEIRQFLISLGVVGALVGGIGAAVALMAYMTAS